MSKLIYIMIIAGSGIAAFGAKELLIYGWDPVSRFEIFGGAVVVIGALSLSGLTRWR